MRYNDRKPNKKALSLVLLFIPVLGLLLTPGCSTSVLKKKGMAYFHVGDFDKAAESFQKGLDRKPRSSEMKTLLFRAKLKSYYQHVSMARQFREANNKEEAIKQYKIALNIFPLNKALEDELIAYENVRKVTQAEFKSTVIPPVALNVDLKEKINIKLPAAPIKKIFGILGKSFNVNIIFDKDFRDFVYGIEIEGVGFYQILNQLCMVSSCVYRVLDSNSILIYPDTTFKRRTFDLQGVKVFYLSNVKVEDAKKLLMTIFREDRIQAQEDPNLNSIIIKAASNTLMDIEKFLYSIDKVKSEVEIDLQIMEINRNILNTLGASYGTPMGTFAAGTLGADGKVNSSFNINDIKNANFFMTIPSAAINFLESDDKTRIISKPNLRGVSGEEISFQVGEERPVPQTSFQSIAAGGVSTVPMTTYTYKPVGVDIKITPLIHYNNEVTLKLKLSLKSVIGYIDEFPILGNRELENIIRLQEGETNIIGGFIEDEVRGTLVGFPGLAKIPLIGKIFGNTKKEIKQKDLIFSITPRVIRRIDISSAAQETIWTNAQIMPQGGSGALIESSVDDASTIARTGANRIMISPTNRTLPVNAFAFFAIRLNSTVDIASVSVSGSVDGPKAVIEELRNDGLREPIKVFKNFSGTSYDIGLSNLDSSSRSMAIAQLKIKFLEKGSYVLKIENASALTPDGKPVEFETNSVDIVVDGSSTQPLPQAQPEKKEEERREEEKRKE